MYASRSTDDSSHMRSDVLESNSSRTNGRGATVMDLARRDLHIDDKVTSAGNSHRNVASATPALVNGMSSHRKRSAHHADPWTCSLLTLACSAIALVTLAVIGYSFTSRHFDNPKGCRMSYMRANFVRFTDFDTEYTRFASKYSLYLYREGGIDDDPRVKGIPVLFIPGNAGSYKQVRPIAAEAAVQYHTIIQHDPAARAAGKKPLDFFTVDFNEDITAFHGQTLLEQADYLNDAVAYILSLYTDPSRSVRDPSLPDPTSVVIVGHSMGGVVARTMLTRSKYIANTINTILTLSAPHIRPPISFDSDMVAIYNAINNYWKRSYSEQWASRNPLWHVTLVSIAGGGLDTVVPSDYASLNTLLPETHGFTVFTSTIPHVWTGMDHLAIMWCDQFRKAVVRALYDVVNVNRPTQTTPRAERMRAFRKRFLTGMEPVVEKDVSAEDPSMLLIIDAEDPSMMTPSSQRLVLSTLGRPEASTKVRLMSIPTPESTTKDVQFSLLSDQTLGPLGTVDVYLCSLGAAHHVSFSGLSTTIDLSTGKPGSTSMRCRSAHVDTIALPPATNHASGYSDENRPFSYLSYDLTQLAEHQFVAIVDKTTEPNDGWVMAEFDDLQVSTINVKRSLYHILLQGISHTLPAARSVVSEIHIPAIHSSLLSFRLDIDQKCNAHAPLFLPLVRQYTSDLHESRFFVNPTSLFVNLHSTSPYLPPPNTEGVRSGLSLQVWTDPACDGPMTVSLKLDMLGSAGQLYMRYRTAFAAFPLLVIALIIRKQFTIYGQSGVFITFAAATDKCIRTSLPLIFLALTFLAVSLTTPGSLWLREQSLNDKDDSFGPFSRSHGNDLLLGFHDRFFWFLIPVFGTVSVGVCIAANYVVLSLTWLFTAISRVIGALRGHSSSARSAFDVTSPAKRLVTTGVLLALVATIIPYQFAYVVLCIVQFVTCVRAQRSAGKAQTLQSTNFHAYTHSVLVLMLWVLPINLPVLIVWIHNLSVQWLTPFSSHHNILSIMPFIFLVETLSTGRMVPRPNVTLDPATTLTRVKSRRPSTLRRALAGITNVLLFGIACFAAVYGVTYAFLLHQLVNGLCAWLLVLHLVGNDRFPSPSLSQADAQSQSQLAPTGQAAHGRQCDNYADLKKDLLLLNGGSSVDSHLGNAGSGYESRSDGESKNGHVVGVAHDAPDGREGHDRSLDVTNESLRPGRDMRTTDPVVEFRRSSRNRKRP